MVRGDPLAPIKHLCLSEPCVDRDLDNQTLQKIADQVSWFEPVHEKTNNLVFRPGPTQIRLYRHRRWLEAGNFGFRK